MQNDSKVSLIIEAKDGRPLRCYSHDGKTFVESHENREYQLRVKNKTGKRIKVVIAVDSLNIISGAAASNDPAETGYLLNPYEEQVYKGFRVDDDTVAQFTFVKREKSYATERGEGAGNGVIAIRAYAEKKNEADEMLKQFQRELDELKNRPREKEYIPVRPWYWEDPWYRSRYPRPYFDGGWWGGYSWGTTTGNTGGSVVGACASTSWDSGLVKCAASAGETTRGFSAQAGSDGINLTAASLNLAAAEENPFSMGSKWGDAVKDSVQKVEFEVGKLLVEESIYYTTIDGLKVLGVNVERVKAVAFPQAFKATYCPPPSGWTR